MLNYFLSSHPFCSSLSFMTSLCGDSDVASTMCPHPFVQSWELPLQLPCRNFGCFSVLQKYHKIWRCCFWMWCPKAIALHTEIYRSDAHSFDDPEKKPIVVLERRKVTVFIHRNCRHLIDWSFLWYHQLRGIVIYLLTWVFSSISSVISFKYGMGFTFLF